MLVVAQPLWRAYGPAGASVVTRWRALHLARLCQCRCKCKVICAWGPLHLFFGLCLLTTPGINKDERKTQVGHHARPRRASATGPLRTGADTCRT